MKRQRGDSPSFNSKPGPGKRRKNYVVHKERETWTDEEHAKFVIALEKYGRAWTKIEEVVGTKTVSQIRSHAQKYFEKIEKQGDMEVVRPADGNLLIEVPWISLPDVLTEKKFLLDRDNFKAWMEKNHLGAPRPAPPPDLMAANADQTQQVISLLDRAVQSVPEQTSSDEQEREEGKRKENENGNDSDINWNRIMKYIAGLARESLEPTAAPEVTIADLNSSEKEFLRVIMTQNIAAVSVDSIRTRIEHFISNFNKSVNPPPPMPSSPQSTSNNAVRTQALSPPANTIDPSSPTNVPAETPTPNTQPLTNSMELFSNFLKESSLAPSRDKND